MFIRDVIEHGSNPFGPPRFGSGLISQESLRRGLVFAQVFNQQGGVQVYDSYSGAPGTFSGSTKPSWASQVVSFPSGAVTVASIDYGTNLTATDGIAVNGFSVFARIFPNMSANGGICEHLGGAAGQGWALMLSNSATNRMSLVIGRVTQNLYGAPTGPTASKWLNVTATYDGSLAAAGVKIYYETVAQSNTNAQNGSGAVNSDAGNNFYVGRGNLTDVSAAGCFDGRIACLYVFNRVILQNEIERLCADPYLLFRSGKSYIFFQPTSIFNISPANGIVGETYDVNIQGTLTHFVNGVTTVGFSGTGITVNSTTVTDSTHVKVNITIAGGATLGSRTVTVTTGSEVVTTSFKVAALADTLLDRASFQYTTLDRTNNNDIRRLPAVRIEDNLGNHANAADYTIDGRSHRPEVGEQVSIVDAKDNNRELFAGTAISVEQAYEGDETQLLWNVKAVDFTFLLNKYRPFGIYTRVSATAVVNDLMSKYAAIFSTNHVQTNLAKVSITLDGTQDLATVLTNIANLIGGGHWYVDYAKDLHFFHKVPPAFGDFGGGKTPNSGMIIGPAAAPTVQAVPYVSTATNFSHTSVYVSYAVTFLYDNGAETMLGQSTAPLYFDAVVNPALQMSNVPIGPDIGTHKCTRRRIYCRIYSTLGAAQDWLGGVPPSGGGRCFEIADNVTTAFHSDSPVGPMNVYVITGPAVHVIPDPTAPFTISLDSQSDGYCTFTPGQTIDFAYVYQGEGSATNFSPITSAVAVAHPLYPMFNNRCLRFKSTDITKSTDPNVTGVSIMYNKRDGTGWHLDVTLQNSSLPTTFTFPEPATGGNFGVADPFVHGVFFSKNIITNQNGNVPPFPVQAPPTGPATAPTAVNNSLAGWYPPSPPASYHYSPASYTAGYFDFCIVNLYRNGSYSLPGPFSAVVHLDGSHGITLSNLPIGVSLTDSFGRTNDVIARFVYFRFYDPTGSNPIYKVAAPSFLIPDNTSVTYNIDLAGFKGPKLAANINDTQAEGGEVWPNPDGPSLEDVSPPGDLTDSNTDLLHEDTGSQPLRSVVDLTQVRNRVRIFGSGSSLLALTPAGSTQIQVADTSAFDPKGGQVVTSDGQVYTAIGFSTTSGNGFVYLDPTVPTVNDLVKGSAINNYALVEDIEAQKVLARLDGTDGVRETTIRDNSLITATQLYMRGFAELEVFARPIVTLTYATRDSKTKSGQTVHVDLSSPPITGDFLIQSVVIDQLHDESDQVSPRYTATCSSSRFDLNDLLMLIGTGNSGSVGGSGGTGVGLQGVVDASSSSVGVRKVGWAQINKSQTVPINVGIQSSQTTGAGTFANSDNANSARLKVTSAAGETNGYGYLFNSMPGPVYLPTFIWVIETDTSIADHFYARVGLSDTANLPGWNDPYPSTRAMVEVRYSTFLGSYQGSSVNNDPGWVGVVQPSVTNPFGVGAASTTPMISTIRTSTVYTIKIQIFSMSHVRFTVNNVSQDLNVALPDITGGTCNTYFGVIGSAGRSINFRYHYFESN